MFGQFSNSATNLLVHCNNTMSRWNFPSTTKLLFFPLLCLNISKTAIEITSFLGGNVDEYETVKAFFYSFFQRRMAFCTIAIAAQRRMFSLHMHIDLLFRSVGICIQAHGRTENISQRERITHQHALERDHTCSIGKENERKHSWNIRT